VLATYLELIQKRGPRALAYAVFSLIAEKEPLVIIVENDDEKQMYEDILEEVVETFEMRKPPSSDIKLAPYEVITKEEYYLNWKKMGGKRLIFTEEDKNLICPGLDHLEKIVNELITGKSRDPVSRLAIRISDILACLEVAKDYFLDYKEGKISEKDFMSLIKSRFPKVEDAEFARAILKTLYDS